ncbi:MAG: redoxin family protein [Phycisphaeraceae bacterium]|nr:redoxin family protein [Phycisphaeraceae bacterium]
MQKRSSKVAVLLACAAAVSFASFSTAASLADEPAKQAAEKQAAEKKAPALGVGDPAPELNIETWVKGDPVTGFEKGRIYVVEFWATWCGPCIVSIPHLTEMAHRFKKDGVTMIGISSSDKDLETVEKFVEKMGDKMDYTVAVDRKVEMEEGGRPTPLTSHAYMTAAGRRGIPCAFVVDRDTKIAWIGHPMMYLESVIEDVAAGRFDAARQQEMEAQADAAMKAMNAAARAGEWDTAMEKLAEYREMHRSHGKRADDIKLNILLGAKKDYDAAYALAASLIDGSYRNDAQSLNELAWRILTDPSIERRDLDLAMRAATRSNELTKGQDPSILDTLARAHFEKGDVDKAVDIQRTAVEKATEEDMKRELEEALSRYLEAQKTK